MVTKVATFCISLTMSVAACLADDQNASTALDAGRHITKIVEATWKSAGIKPAGEADDAAFLRRASLDVMGRIPTTEELDAFVKDKAADKRAKIVHAMFDGPEFSLHWGNVLDHMIQGRHAGNDAFVDYLRAALRDGKSWERLFQEMMLGPWDAAQTRPANRFLDRRAKTLDVLTSDTARVFFGVDISCAKCHDHPLVDDWKQSHFYGMAAFLNRTTGGKGTIGEKKDGEVKFVGADGKEQTAKMMFLSGKIVEEQAPQKGDRFSRRAQLVTIALEDRAFLSRSFVNRVWDVVLGRGLVMPVDQMHAANKAAIPELLDWLAADFQSSGYNIRRLVEAIVLSRPYGLSSEWPANSPEPDATSFAVFRLKPLDRRQLAFSLRLATGSSRFTPPDKIRARAERLAGLDVTRVEQFLRVEAEAESLLNAFDPRAANFQSSAIEALFLSNHADIQNLVIAGEDNLTARLAKVDDTQAIVRTLVRSVFSREPSVSELDELSKFLSKSTASRASACEQLVWALITSAEFRFNH
ncbi:MAG: DUF1549 domain-containing protein [Planctomycetota bacterium]|nr:DUF1549 domain-containing protein [Planctomycetota bacterium]